MKVHDYAITERQEHVCLQRMVYPFTAFDIESAARVAGVPHRFKLNPIAMRFADRLIQRERKVGRIVRDGKGWKPK